MSACFSYEVFFFVNNLFFNFLLRKKPKPTKMVFNRQAKFTFLAYECCYRSLNGARGHRQFENCIKFCWNANSSLVDVERELRTVDAESSREISLLLRKSLKSNPTSSNSCAEWKWHKHAIAGLTTNGKANVSRAHKTHKFRRKWKHFDDHNFLLDRATASGSNSNKA